MIQKRRKPNRLRGYDYTKPGLYYVTICTKNRIHYFGGIHDETMCINRLGSIAWRQWEWLAGQYDYVRTHAFVVMPNHVHGVLEIVDMKNDPIVGTGRDLSLRKQSDDGNIKTKSLSQIVGAYKTTTSKLIHQIPFPHFVWQRSFHDHIIKTERAYQNIYRYIVQNPKMWGRDRNNI